MIRIEELNCDIWTDYCKREEAERMGLTQKQYDRWYTKKLGKAYIDSMFKRKSLRPVKYVPKGGNKVGD